MKNIFILIFTILFLVMTFADTSAIPAFARKYNMSCKTCHSPFPSLKSFGEEFAGNGFVLSDQDAPRYYVETGDPELSLIRDIPLAMRLDGYITYNNGNEIKTDFVLPLSFKLLSGGTIAKDVAYYLYYILERGERGIIEDAWVMFNDVFGSNLDIIAGQFQVSDPLFKRELRLTRDDYIIYKIKTGASNVDLTYDRGIMFAYGFETGTDLVFEVINGNGIGESFGGRFDNDKYKNFLGRISQNAGDHIRIGAMGYIGKEQQRNVINNIRMVGGDLTVTLDPLEFNFQYIRRNDGNPGFVVNELSEVTEGTFAEVIFRPEGDDSRYYGVLLFNWVSASIFRRPEYKTLSGHLGYLLSRNFRLVVEAGYDLHLKSSSAGFGIITAF